MRGRRKKYRGKQKAALEILPDLAGSQLICIEEDSVVVSDTGATASLVLSRWLADRDLLLGKCGLPRDDTCPALSRFKFGGGRMRDVRFAADITAGVAGSNGDLTSSVLRADIPAFSR